MKKTILSVALATAVSSTLPVFADAAEPKNCSSFNNYSANCVKQSC